MKADFVTLALDFNLRAGYRFLCRITITLMVSKINPLPINSEIVISTLKKHQTTLNKLRVKSLALFGSVARNQATTDSDLDFLVEFEEITFDGYMDLKFFLEDLFNKKVDLVIKTDLKPQIKETVINEAIDVA